MFTYNYVRYIHHKPPYKPLKLYNFCNEENDDLTCCNKAKAPSWMENNKEEIPQNKPAIKYPVTVPKTYEFHNDSNLKKDMTVIASTDSDPPDPPEIERLIEDDNIDDVQKIAEIDINETSVVSFNDDKRAELDSQNDDLPLISEEIPLSEPFECDVHSSIAPAIEQPLYKLIDATSQLTDAVTRLIDAADTKSCDREERCGLLHFREWWELDEVSILVGGKLIDGVPIFVEEDTLRVINNNYSYFIPLRKVDYIRTTDGLNSGFDLSDDNPNRK